MNRRSSNAIAMFVAVFALSAVPGCGLHGKPKVERKSARGVVADTRRPADDVDRTARVVAPGIVEPWGGETELSPQESGYVARIVVNEGDHVSAGQLLAELDTSTQRASVALANAELAEAEALLARTVRGTPIEELRQVRAEAAANEVRASLAARDAERARRLGSDQVVAPSEVDRSGVEAEVQAALARAGSARLAAMERGARPEDRTAARERVAAARARQSLAEANLARRRVVAPNAGEVLLSRSHVGEFFAVGARPLFILGDTSKLQVRLEVDEIDVSRVQEGTSCSLRGDDGVPIVDGVVVRLAPKMGRRGLVIESPTARADVRIREIFVEVNAATALVPGQRVWGYVEPHILASSTSSNK